MKKIIQSDLNSQRGAATLFTALVLLIGITLVTMTTSKTVLVETQMTADNYRAAQAVAAANYAMDYGVNYFNKGGFDQKNNTTGAAGSDGIVDVVSVPNLASSYGGQTTTGTVTFNNATGTRCAPSSATMKSGMVTATGFSDDGLASRTITQCVVPLKVLRDDGPKQPLVAQGNVAVTGSAQIINRYTNTTIWSGDKVAIGSSSSMATYIKSPTAGTLTLTELLDTSTSNNTQLASNRNLGNNLDIIDEDPSLGTLTGLDFFKNFFNADSRAQLKAMATYVFTDIASANGKSGLIWVEGNQNMGSITVGSQTSPAIMVVDGNLSMNSNPTFYGLLYVIGKFDIGGTPTVVGASVVEGTNSAGAPATPPIVSGNGTLTLVYWAGFESNAANPMDGLTSPVSGSWRDW